MDVRPDENVELFTLHLHVVLLLIELVLQSCVDVHQFITAQLFGLCLQLQLEFTFSFSPHINSMLQLRVT